VVLIGDFLEPLPEIQRAVSILAARPVRGHVLQVLDPAEETLPYLGRIRFEGLEAEEPALVPRVEGVRELYDERLRQHRAGVAAIAAAGAVVVAATVVAAGAAAVVAVGAAAPLVAVVAATLAVASFQWAVPRVAVIVVVDPWTVAAFAVVPARDPAIVFDPDRYGAGSTGVLWTRTSKCRCGPVHVPVQPTRPITSPMCTYCPTRVPTTDRCA
jgi:hypothetical protein